MLPSADFVNRAIHYMPAANLVYLNNPKVACSTIKTSLWRWFDGVNGKETFAGNPHARGLSPFCNNLHVVAKDMDGFVSSTFFTVVRNPFSRLLSGYLDKVSRPKRDPNVWFDLAASIGVEKDARPSFGDFVRLVTNVDPSLVDRHFAPQVNNVLYDYTSADFIGHLEKMKAVEAFLVERGIAVEQFAPHPTNAAGNILSYFGNKEVELVRAYYGRDFEVFGYSFDPAVQSPIHDVKHLGIPRSRVATLISEAIVAPSKSRPPRQLA